ncbi:hypothetical protein XELAEV_18007291mg [Xenopus laevis]|uniref:Ig-like domain-containing protein n=1 Tax=Xenopus laevis TaxID=8355 RepID=A0A974E1M1_XENLA|nr:hypothetical protein XELAEV_18007291mg [Xenopus laevis]
MCCFLLDEVRGDSVEQPVSSRGQAGQEIILMCSYSSSSSYPCLFWYRQYPNSPLQLIFRIPSKSGACGRHKAQGFNRFDAVADTSSTRMTIASLRPSDMAIYYCAVADFHTGTISCTAVKKTILEEQDVGFPIVSFSPL